MIFSRNGELLAREQILYEPFVRPYPGWAEQYPEVYWEALGSACKKLQKNASAYFDLIAGVGITTMRNSMVNVDQQGMPLRPLIVWMDQRQALPVWGHKGFWGLGLAAMGVKKKLENIQIQGKCNWIMQNQPGIWEKTYKYLQLSGFLNLRMTGEFADSVASQIGYIPFNYRKQKWATSFSLPKNLFPVESDKLSMLVPPGELLGGTTRSAALHTGLKEGTPVFACGSDKGCDTLGAGVISPSMASLSFGTIATVQTVFDRYIEPVKYLPSYPSPMPGQYNPEIEIFRGFWMITWFKKEFAHKEVLKARELGVPTEAILDQCLERTPPGAMGLVVQPYWGGGLDQPEAKGAMIGFGDIHTKDHIYRAVIEGLGFALRDGIKKIREKTGTPVLKAAVSGGASQSDEICQIAADILDLPMIKGQTHETSGLGAAILVAKGLGIYPDIRQAVENMVHVNRIFSPDKTRVKIYRQLYEKVYTRIYTALKPLYADIREITGYPE